jgi:hypothetical protein
VNGCAELCAEQSREAQGFDREHGGNSVRAGNDDDGRRLGQVRANALTGVRGGSPGRAGHSWQPAGAGGSVPG